MVAHLSCIFCAVTSLPAINIGSVKLISLLASQGPEDVTLLSTPLPLTPSNFNAFTHVTVCLLAASPCYGGPFRVRIMPGISVVISTIGSDDGVARRD
ncbi:uncharacterized protein EI90DRAFT_3039502 [Cantharellus anzutake]|uniref:uncharacterized protein n=1 Tax=Cantharellus anzutake TaxID=1750568 RepID=UPI0019039807|nr:uncharacterized protein EI90DRAFT_3039502 [Cantharellus anzutake]KAF8338872.1 hypothetical protein EI90DRAFT_3039502 [Cantharellus anzutake]